MNLQGVSSRFVVASAVTLASLFVAAPAHAAFTITPVFDAGIANDPNASAIESDINSVVSLYESKFTDNINVKVYFQKGGGLGTSAWGYYWNGAGTALSALANDAKSTDDIVAVSHLGTSGFGDIAYTTANGRALGLNTPGFMSAGGESDFDGIISLNTDICFYDHHSPKAGRYDLYSAAAHELDEVLGTPSGAGGALAFTADLYRYDGHGNRSFSGDTSTHAYFSIDGTTLIDEYNQFNRTGGDWGDWIAHDPSQTQDWAVNSGIEIDPGEPEFRLLDAVGYDRAPVPEPASMTALGFGVLVVLRRRRKSRRPSCR